MVTRHEFKQAAGLSDTLTDRWHQPLTSAAGEYVTYTPCIMAHVIAQFRYESAGFTRLEEGLNYSADRLLKIFKTYLTLALAGSVRTQTDEDCRPGLCKPYGNGSKASGDGLAFRGAGLIQLTAASALGRS